MGPGQIGIAERMHYARAIGGFARLAEWLVVAALLVACGFENGTQAEIQQPNVLLISVDTLRADHLGAYGYDRNTSPHFDAFAAEAYGSLRAELESKGPPIGPLDTLIASHALSIGVTLITNNEREFRRVPGLNVENWLTDGRAGS